MNLRGRRQTRLTLLARECARHIPKSMLYWGLRGLRRMARRALRPLLAGIEARYRAELARTRKQLHRMRREIDKACRFSYGSFTPGVKEWEAKWTETPGKRVLMYALKDYSGSFMGWARAINRNTEFAARLAVFEIHQYGYDVDLVFPYPEHAVSGFRKLVEEADLLHVKDEVGLLRGDNPQVWRWLLDSGKPIIFTHYGGYARSLQHNADYVKLVRGFAARVAMTPDLCFDWFDGGFIPHAIDTDRYGYTWRDGNVIGHSPSNPERKGTAELLKAAEGLDVRVDVIYGVSHEECLARKSRCNLFFDQAGRESREKLGVDTVIGWYGNAAIEAAAFGIPVIVHMSQEAFERAERAGCHEARDCPFLNTLPGAAGIRRTIEAYFRLAPEDRVGLSRQTRAWAERFHSYASVGRRLEAMYGTVLGVGR